MRRRSAVCALIGRVTWTRAHHSHHTNTPTLVPLWLPHHSRCRQRDITFGHGLSLPHAARADADPDPQALVMVFFVLQLWYGPCSFSEMFFTNKLQVCVFFYHIIIFSHFF